jgi:hypothetical protein
MIVQITVFLAVLPPSSESHEYGYKPSSSYIATNGQSASSSWFRAPFGADDQILNFFLLHVGRPLENLTLKGLH